MDLASFTCPSDKQDEIFAYVQKNNLSFNDIYDSAQSIAQFALDIKSHLNKSFVYLPFCHTVEAESMGADILLGDQSAGARAGSYTCSSFDDLFGKTMSYPPDMRISKMLSACSILKERGEKVIFMLSGPFSILNCLIDPKIIFKTWRKEKDKMERLLHSLSAQLTDFSKKFSPPAQMSYHMLIPPAILTYSVPRIQKSFFTHLPFPLSNRCPLFVPTESRYSSVPLHQGALPKKV